MNSALYCYRARTYDPKVGRFLQTDPLEPRPEEMNAYVYVANNPANLIDPTSLACGDYFRDPIVPDKPLGFDFTDCCQKHDNCYGGFCGESKTREQCDQDFINCAIKQCNKGRGGQRCYGVADIYYDFIKRKGEDAFKDARKKNQCRRCHPW